MRLTTSLVTPLISSVTWAPAGNGAAGTFSHVWFSVSDNVSLSDTLGFIFTVGASPLTVTQLGYYGGQSSYNETVKIWRNSDQALIASASIPSTLDQWTDVDITPVVLSAATDYTISHYRGGARNLYRNPTALAVDSAITKGGNVYSTGDVFPNTPSGNTYASARFTFTV